jgi:hypothetical protein
MRSSKPVAKELHHEDTKSTKGRFAQRDRTAANRILVTTVSAVSRSIVVRVMTGFTARSRRKGARIARVRAARIGCLLMTSAIGGLRR